MSIITLITDFGLDDEYVGLMKGVILSIHPSATIIDITHRIEPQDVEQAAYTLYTSYGYFPDDSIHLIVVDPGVGGERAIVAARLNQNVFIAPDNGTLTLLFDQQEADECIRVDNPQYFLNTVSQTFHGRDIFAPVAAHIARGVALNRIGTAAKSADLVRLPGLKSSRSADGEIAGKIVTVDHFGNLITNISANELQDFCNNKPGCNLQVRIGSITISGLSNTYESVDILEPLALIGSRGYLEIAVNRGSANTYLNVQKGDGVTIVI